MNGPPNALDIAIPGFSQQPRLLGLDTPDGRTWIVERFSGEEAVCAPFRFDIDCLSADKNSADALLGQPLRLHLRGADQRRRAWHGLCTGVASLGSDGGWRRHRLTLEPWTALLALRRNALIFQDCNALDVLERVFVHYPAARWRFDVTRSLPARAIITQYRESDAAFVERLLAEAGLAWRYEHDQGDDADAASGSPGHTLVVFDRDADLPVSPARPVRFHRIDASESDDAISELCERRAAVPALATVASWQPAQVSAQAGVAQAQDDARVPAREVFKMPRVGRLDRGDDAEQQAALLLDALCLPRRLQAGSGSARGLAAGAAFALTGHAQLDGERLVPLRIEHVASNELGTGIAALQDTPALERGSYRNRFVCVPADTPLVPASRPRPTASGAQTARVVGLPDAAVTSTRDHQVRIQFAWQRGARPLAGGLHDTGSSQDADGHAPGDDRSGTWVRVAEWLAGPNWGSHALPRIGSEVLVEFLHGDIDQPVVTGQLYNGEVPPPFAAGHDTGSNHAGTMSGLHSRSLDGSHTQQWVIDDAPGQLRQRLHTSLADSRLELGYLIAHADAHRGGLQGLGFNLSTQGWGSVRADQGLLLSTTPRGQAASTQFDMTDAVAQLKGAERTAARLHDTLRQQRVPGLDAAPALTAMRQHVDVDEHARHPAQVNGQPAFKPGADGREPGQAPVERLASPLIVAESPDAIALTTPGSAAAHASGHVHLTVQDDLHMAAGQTHSTVAGQHAALYAHAGPLRVIAAAGPVSVQAHTGALELLADQSVTITATDERIDVLAAQKIVLQAGRSRITLQGGDITFECPGEFSVKASQHPFLGAESGAAQIPPLPEGTMESMGSAPFSV